MMRTLQVDAFKQDVELGLNVLSSIKNQWMLLLLIRFLQGEMALAQVEKNLTLLAECVFGAMIRHMYKANRQFVRQRGGSGHGQDGRV